MMTRCCRPRGRVGASWRLRHHTGVPFQHATFEGLGHLVRADHPRGIVYVFHGTGGSANFAEKIETTDVLNRLIARGYGFVSTSSTERTGNKRWNAPIPR